jgi:catechol O-methyltransferase
MWAFNARNVFHFLVDKLRGAPPRPLRARDYVARHATPGDPASVLSALDRYATEERWLMSVGPEKGPLLSEMIGRIPKGARVLELGAYCGYSAIMICQRLAPPGALVSVEVSPANAAKLQGPFDLVFLDHWKDLYKTDLELLEQHGMLRPGSIVVADNTGDLFSPETYLTYVRTCGRYDSESREAHIEYSQLPDAVRRTSSTRSSRTRSRSPSTAIATPPSRARRRFADPPAL